MHNLKKFPHSFTEIQCETDGQPEKKNLKKTWSSVLETHTVKTQQFRQVDESYLVM